MDNAGAVIGPLLATLFLSLGVPLQDIFLWAIVPAVITIGLALCIQEPKKEAVPQAYRFSWSLEGMPDQFKRYLVAAGIFALANSSDMFLLLRAREVGVPQEHIPLLWAGISLITTLFGTPLSALSDIFGRKRFILVAWIAFAFFFIAMGLPGVSVYQIFALFAIYGLFKAATEGVEKALVADMAPKGLAGTAFGWFNLITGIMLLPASFIFGWIYESVAPLYAFLFSGSCAVIAFALMIFWVSNPAKGDVAH
jgi:MFS family permease